MWQLLHGHCIFCDHCLTKMPLCNFPLMKVWEMQVFVLDKGTMSVFPWGMNMKLDTYVKNVNQIVVIKAADHCPSKPYDQKNMYYSYKPDNGRSRVHVFMAYLRSSKAHKAIPQGVMRRSTRTTITLLALCPTPPPPYTPDWAISCASVPQAGHIRVFVPSLTSYVCWYAITHYQACCGCPYSRQSDAHRPGG